MTYNIISPNNSILIYSSEGLYSNKRPGIGWSVKAEALFEVYEDKKGKLELYILEPGEEAPGVVPILSIYEDSILTEGDTLEFTHEVCGDITRKADTTFRLNLEDPIRLERIIKDSLRPPNKK